MRKGAHRGAFVFPCLYLFAGHRRRAELREAKLVGASAIGASFRFAQLVEVDFTRALLINASFQHADVTGANFGYSSLQGANFAEAHGIDSADFTNAVM